MIPIGGLNAFALWDLTDDIRIISLFTYILFWNYGFGQVPFSLTNHDHVMTYHTSV